MISTAPMGRDPSAASNLQQPHVARPSVNASAFMGIASCARTRLRGYAGRTMRPTNHIQTHRHTDTVSSVSAPPTKACSEEVVPYLARLVCAGALTVALRFIATIALAKRHVRQLDRARSAFVRHSVLRELRGNVGLQIGDVEQAGSLQQVLPHRFLVPPEHTHTHTHTHTNAHQRTHPSACAGLPRTTAACSRTASLQASG